MTEYFRRVWELDVGIQHLHRGRAPAERPRSGLHPRREGDLAGGLRRRVADGRHLTVKGDLISRGELFDEADLDTALARFDELSRPAPQLENAASQVVERFRHHFAARDWDAMAEMLAADMSNDDRRRVVNAGIRRGRDAEIENMRAPPISGVTNITSTVDCDPWGAPRPLSRPLVGTRPRGPRSSNSMSSTSSKSTLTSGSRRCVTFDPDDIDAAFEELDARYLAGEAAAHAHTWSVITRAYAALNRTKFPPTTADFVNIDHRRRGSVCAR